MLKAFTDNGLIYPIHISLADHPTISGFPWLRPSDCLRKMAFMNDLNILLGGMRTLAEAAPVLRTFWERYEAIFPNHQVFKSMREKGVDLAKCLPIYLHGDEGISFKKGGILICSWQSAFGFGCSKRMPMHQGDDDGMPLNFRKSGIQTRILSIACPKAGCCHDMVSI